MENEIWKDVPGYVGFYQVSSKGRVMRLKQILPSLTERGKRVHLRELKQIPRGVGGRLSVTLCAYSETKWFQVHRLVLLAFVGPCPEGEECRHKDGNHLNNNLGNLHWGTRTENMRDKTEHGTQLIGEKNHNAKLDEDAVREIRASKETIRELAKKYGVSSTAICFIRTHKTWGHVV